ncbi:DUF308 domain-containing protein [Micromonospora sp. C95]|uniref:DUF308 domain-containing protein n=1 Tax=Micromonospora sp. C95 TaxID=2824882 RepID=UPI001B3828ED|nr:DUF308 domain-containing protein [Micromonospora sp. C95]MBQ1025530.1 DUF308 domain-containing protein [Micromonospora sp. C95]
MMKFPSLLRRDESAAPTDDERGRTGTVATDTRSGARSDVADSTDGSTGQRRTSSGNTVVTGRTTAGRSAGPDTDRAAPQPDAERAAEARAATARSTVHGSRSARAAATGTTDRDRTTEDKHSTDLDRTADRDRTADDKHATDLDRTAAADRAVDADRRGDRDRIAGTVDQDRSVDDDRTADGAASRDVPPAPVGPRPRASLLATLGLIVGVGSVLFVLTGALAGYGIALGTVGAVLAVLGLMATRRRHIAGKSDALLGIAFGLGAVVLGVLAMTGQYDWPTTDGDTVVRFREWLDSQFVDRL